MKKIIICCVVSLFLMACSSGDDSSDNGSLPENSNVLETVLINGEEDFNKLFPHANERPSSIQGADLHLYSYDNIKAGLDWNEAFSVFMSEGDDTIKRLELAAILANWAQETTGGWDTAPDGYASWGLCFQEEDGARPSPDHCYYDPYSKYQPTTAPVVGAPCFFGRGPIQLSWNSNYGAFSEFIYDGDMSILLNDPDEILRDGALAFASGFWFWTLYKGSPNVPDKTCHEVMVEEGAKGFGKVINIVNGGIECNKPLPPFDDVYGKKIRHRADHFQYFAADLGVDGELPVRPEGAPKDNDQWNAYYRAMLVGCID